MTFNIKEELKKLPDQPGVYIMHDASDAIIYVCLLYTSPSPRDCS